MAIAQKAGYPIPELSSRTLPSRILLASALISLLSGLSALPGSAATFRVDVVTGSDGAGCGSEASPCASIQQAVDLASSGDVILVSEGVYTDDVSCQTIPAVVCVFQKELTLQGGFSSGNWTLPDPENNTTIIDGQNTRSGVVVLRGGPNPGFPDSSLKMEGFTVRNGRIVGAPHGFGGGLKANFSDIELRDMTFEDNVALGGSGGLAGGGGVAIQATADRVGNVVLVRVVFRNNQATGGGGTGAAAQGGGLFIDHAFVSAQDLEFSNNTATGGASSTTGRDGLGGGLAFSFGTTGTLSRVVASGNQAHGGAASTTGGSAFGGAVFLEGAESPAAEQTSITLLDSQFSNNLARGGNASTARGGVGGAISTFGAPLTLERSQILGNQAEGGTGDTDGNAGGGGVFLEWPFNSVAPSSIIRNSIIAENSMNGFQGGGAGLRLLGTRATVTHVTLVDNRSLGVGLGLGILAGPRLGVASELTLEYSILANHRTPSGGRALHVQSESTAILTDRSLFVGNTNDTNQGEVNSGTYVDFPGSNLFDASLADFFVDPTTSDYHIDGTIPPTDSAVGSTETLDVDGETRSGDRDLGADELGAVTFGLTIAKSGLGTGVVTSSPAGIDCGGDCFETYTENTVVTLTATPDASSDFTGWTGAADCTDGSVLMSQDLQCTAQFEPEVCSVAEEDLVLTGDTVNGTRREEACQSITAGPSYAVGSSGSVTFVAPVIILRDGFSVSGSFVAISDTP